MIHFSRLLLLTAVGLLAAETPAPPAAESLRYTVNWPSGLSLGEALLTTGRDGDRVTFEFVLDASIPGFAVGERYRALATPALCSLELRKTSTRGTRKTNENTRFDPVAGTATRSTDKGGQSEIATGPCARDALAYLAWVRQELARGRMAQPQTVYLGAAYSVRLEHGGTASVSLADKPVEADRLLLSIQGPASSHRVELFFAKDGSRPLLQAKVPLALGTFSLELVR